MALTSKQRKQLRSMANTLNDTLLIGKYNINNAAVEQTHRLLTDHELIKGKVLEASELTAREAADILVDRTGAECVQVIGRKFVLYRESTRKDIKKIELED